MSDLINVRVKATGDFSDVVGSIKQMQGALNNLKMPNLSDGLSKNLSSLIKEVEKFQSIREKTNKTKGDLKNLDNSAMQIAKIYSNINKELDKMGRADLKKYLNFDSPELKQAQTKVAELENKIRGLYKNLNKNIIKPTIDDKSFSQFAEKSNKLQSMWRQFHFNVDSGDLKEAVSTLEQIQKYAPSLKSVVNNTELGGLKGLNKVVDNAKRGITEALAETSKFNSELAESKQHLNNLVNTRIEGLSSGIQKITNSLNQMESETMQAVNAERQLAHESYDIGSQLGDLKTSANYFFGLQNMFYLMRSGLRETLDTVKELDKAMTDTAVVTDFTVPEMWAKLPQYTKLANELGATTKGAYETMTLYYQQGLNTEQAFSVGTETMKMARIAGLDYADTTNMMTAALRGFNMEIDATSAKRVNDVYSKLAAITASDTRELGQAMERTASIAHSAGMDFGNTTAFLAQMIETTREAPENLGTAMKTIVARFQELKENPGKIGEVEGEEVNYNRIDKALKSIGVSLVDNKDKFRDLDDVFMDISEKWDSLTQMQQRYIATTAAGSRQQSRFIAMVGNYQRLLQLTDAAANSEGAADVQFNKTLDSMEAKLNKLHNAWDRFMMGITNNSFLKGAVDFGTDILDIVNNIIDEVSKAASNINKSFGSAVKSVMSLTLAFTGLKLGGKVINKGLGALGNLVDPQGKTGKGMFGGLFGGITGRKAAYAGVQAQAISNPIVAAINAGVAKITGTEQKIGAQFKQAQNNSFDRNAFKQAQQNLRFLPKKGQESGIINSKIVGEQLKNFNTERQRILLKQVPGTREALERVYIEATRKLNLSEPAQNAVTQFRAQISKEMLKPGGIISPEAGLNLMGNPSEFIKNISDKEVQKELGREIFKNRKKYAQEADVLGIDDRAARKKYIKERELEFNPYKNINTRLTSSELRKNTFAGITAGATAAGQAVMNLGLALDQLGLHTTGSAITMIGSTITSIGLAASGAIDGVKSLREGIASLKGAWTGMSAGMQAGLVGGLGVAGFAAALGATALIVQHYEKNRLDEIKKNAKEVEQTYEKTISDTTQNLNKLEDYRGDFEKLSKGVDSNGNNISLGTAEYNDYLKISKELAKINPKLIKGYNAQGQAIINRDKAIESSIQVQKKAQEDAIKTYTKDTSLDKLLDARNITKRYAYAKKTADKIEGGRLAGEMLNTKTTSRNQFERDTQTIIDNINKLEDKSTVLSALSKQYGIDFSTASEEVVKTMQKHGSDILDIVSNTATQASSEEISAIQNGIATLGKHTEGFEKAIEPIYKNLSTYAAQQDIFKNIPEQFQNAAQEGLKELAKLDYYEENGKLKKVTGSYLQSRALDLGKEIERLTGPLSKYQQIMEKASKAQEDFGRTGNIQDYENAINGVGKGAEDLVGQLETLSNTQLSVDPIVNEIIQEDFQNALESIQNFTSEGSALLEEGFNTFANDIAAANTAFEKFQKDIEGGDFYTAANNMKQIFDEIQDGIDNVGKGSATYWKGVEELAGERIANKGSKKVAKAALTAIEPMLQEGKAGVDAFLDHVIDSAPNASKEFKKAFEGTGIKTVQDVMGLNEKGEFEINIDDLNDKQFTALADNLGMSDQLLTSMLNKARQFYDIDFTDWGTIRQGLMSQASQGNGAVAGTLAKEGEENKVYARKSELREQAREQGIIGKELKNWLKEAGKQGVEAITKSDLFGKNNKLGDLMRDWGIATGTKATKDSGTELLKNLDYLHYGKENQEKAFKEAQDQNLISKDLKFDDIYEQAQNEIKSAEAEPNSAEEQTADATAGTEANTATLCSLLGGLDLTGIEKKEKELNGGKGDDTTSEKFAKGLNDKNQTLTKEEYESTRKELEQERTKIEQDIQNKKIGLQKITDEAQKKEAQGIIDREQAIVDAYDKRISAGDKAYQKIEEQNKKNDAISKAQQETEKQQKELGIDEFLKQNAGMSVNYNELFGAKTGQINEQAVAFGNLVKNLELTDKQTAILNSTLGNFKPGALKDFTQEDFSQLLSNLNLTDEQLSKLEKIDPEFKVKADTKEAEQKSDKLQKDFEKPATKKVKVQEEKTTTTKANTTQSTKPTKEEQSDVKGKFKADIDQPVKVHPKIESADEIKKGDVIQKITPKKAIPVKVPVKVNSDPKGDSGSIKEKVGNFIKKGLSGVKGGKTTTKVAAKTTGTEGVNNLSKAIKGVKDKTVKVKASVKGTSSVNSLVSAISNLHDKSITITTNKVTKNKAGAIGINNKIIKTPLPSFNSAAEGAGSAARGNYGQVGPKGKGGLTLTGEKGFEIAWLPSENRSMILGANGPQMINLPSDAVVWTNEQSKKILSQKAIPAGSHSKSARGKFKPDRGGGSRASSSTNVSSNSNSSSSSRSSSSRSSSSNKKKSNKKNSKASLKELNDQKKVNTRIFNLEKQIEQVKNRQEKKQKEINKALQKTAITLLGISKTGTSYIATIRKNISLNKELVKIYNQQLKNLDSNTKKSAATIKWEQKYQKKTKKGKKKTTTKQKTATVNLGKYIKYDSATGAYLVDQDAINNDKRFNNKEAREAVKNAAQDKINDKVSKRDSAQKEIDSGNDALNEYAQQLYETFYGWKNELTEIYIQTKKIAALESQISRYKELTSLYDAQLSSGLQKATTEFTQKISEAFQVQINAAVNQIHAQSKNIDLNFNELLKINSTNDIEREISSVQQKISNGRIANTNAANYAKAQNKVNKDNKAIAAKKKVEQTTSLKKEQAKVKKSDNQIKAANKIINSKKSSKTKKANAQKTKAKATAAKKTANTNIKTIKEGQAAQKTVKADTTKANNLKAINNKTASSRLTEDQLIAEQKRLEELQDTLKAEGIAKELISFNPEQAKAGNILFDFNVEELLKRRDSGAISSKQYEVIKNKFDEISEKATELNSAYAEITQKITELYTQLTEVKEQYASASEDLLEGIEKSSEVEAEKLQDLNESITNALRDLLDEVKKRLDQRRQQENNAKTEEDISQKQNRLNALRADSSGSNAKEIKQLEKEIADSQRDYERSLEDQTLERLTEQADKAAEQRERIIEVLNNQLDYAKTSGQNLDRVNMLIDAVKDPTKIDKETLEQFKTEIQQYWRSNNNYDQSTIKRREVLDNQFETYWSSITGGLLGKEKTLEKAIEEVKAEQEKIEEATKGLLNQSNLQSDETHPIPEQKQSNAVTYSVPKNTVSNEEANKKVKENEAKKKAQEAAQKKAKETAQKKAKETAQKKAQETAQKKAKEAAYKKAINDAQSNGKIGKDEFLKVKSIAEAAGYGAARYMKDLANTKGLTWKQVIKAAKDAGFNRDRIAYTFTSDNARKGYKAVYGESWYTAYDRAKKRKVAAYKYATGGLNTQTGPAWLDGTPSKPELILNARDTQNFLALKDILNKTLTNAKTINNSNDMTNFEININVDKIEKDYDVDRMIERVKKEITRSSGYRNVAAVRSFR